MPLFGSHKKHNKNNNSNSPLSLNSLTPTSSNKSLQNITLNNPLGNVVGGNNSSNQQNNIKLSINIESPPIVLYGNPKESSGSLLSGLLKLEILYKQSALNLNSGGSLTLVRSNPAYTTNDTLTIKSVTLSLTQVIHYGKPFLPPSSTLQSCPNCKLKKTELARWDVLTEPTDFLRGTEHGYPFSHLVPGSLPQTTSLSTINMIIDYELVAKAIISRGKKSDEIIQISLPIIIKRSILRGPDRNSVRIFPPTELTASLVLPNVLYPKSSFPIELKLDNVSVQDRRWRMRKLNWRLEENIKVKLNSCDLHKFKLKVVEDHTRKLNLQKINPLLKKRNISSPHVSTSFEPPPESSINITETSNPSSSSSSSSPSSTLQQQQQQQQPELVPQTSNTGISPVRTETPTQQHSNRNNLDELLDNDTQQRPLMNETRNLENQEPVLDTEDLVIPELPKNTHALYLEETRTISHGEIKNGWKSDFSNKGRIELVTDIDLANLSTIGLSSSLNNLTSIDSTNSTSPLYNIKNLMNNVSSTCSCDLFDDTLGIYVSHLLIIEMVVAEELLQGTNAAANHVRPQKSRENRLAEVSPLFANASLTPKMSSSNSNGKSSDNKVGIPTGAARVLRMQFKVILTERSGLGIAWDDEVPPTYQDVRLLSPPTYDQTLNVAQLSGLDATPSLNLLSFPEPAAHSQINHRTPGVLYGGGDTPGANFSNFDLNTANTEELENFLDLRI